MDIEAAKAANESATTHVTDSLKWLVGSAGATAAVLVAGLQLQSTHLADGAAWIYAIAATLAVSSALATLFGAARVLSTERMAAPVIAQREFDSNRVAGKPLTDDKADAVVAWIQDQRGPALLGTAVSVTELIQRTQKGAAEERTEAFARLGLVEAALHLHRIQTAVRKLIGWVVALSIVFVLSIATLVLVPSLIGPPEDVLVDKPVPVDVIVIDAEKSDIPRKCGTTFRGVAIGGTLDDPLLVISPSAACGPMELEDASGLVVIPR